MSEVIEIKNSGNTCAGCWRVMDDMEKNNEF